MCYLSLDTEATGLGKNSLLIHIALVPLDVNNLIVKENLSWSRLIRIPSYDDLLPSLNNWVRKNLKSLIEKAHKDGIPLDECRDDLVSYLSSQELKDFLNGEQPVLLGKSLSALDIPLLNKSFGLEFMQKYFHHHTIDITSIARYLCDASLIPKNTFSTTKVMNYFNIRKDPTHDALTDAIDMAKIYLKMIQLKKT